MVQVCLLYHCQAGDWCHHSEKLNKCAFKLTNWIYRYHERQKLVVVPTETCANGIWGYIATNWRGPKHIRFHSVRYCLRWLCGSNFPPRGWRNWLEAEEYFTNRGTRGYKIWYLTSSRRVVFDFRLHNYLLTNYNLSNTCRKYLPLIYHLLIIVLFNTRCTKAIKKVPSWQPRLN